MITVRQRILKLMAVGFCLTLVRGECLSAEPDWVRLIEFRNTVRQDTQAMLDVWGAKAFSLEAWKDNEQTAVIKHFGFVYTKVPGLLERAATYGTIPLYRIEQQYITATHKAAGAKSSAVAAYGAIWYNSIFDIENLWVGMDTFLHEFAHVVDAEQKIVRSSEFRTLVEPRIAKVLDILKEKGWTLRDAKNAGQEQIARNVGLPSLYAVTNIQEALAEYTKFILIDKNFSPPSEVKKFMEQKVFSKPASSDSSVTPFRRGLTLLGEKKFDEAIINLTEAIHRDPQYASAYYFRGRTLNEKGLYDDAINDFSRALEMMSKYDFWRAEIIYRRGVAWLEKNNFEKAIADFNEILLFDPFYVEGYIRRGYAWLQKGEFDKAIADYSKAIEIRPTAQVYWYRAIGWKNKKEIDNAILDLTEVIRLSPDYNLAYYARGELWYEKEKFDKAAQDFGEFIKYQPNNAKGYQYRGISKYQLDDFDGAIADLSKAVSLQQENWYAFHVRGLSYGSKKEFLNAKKDLQEALRLNPQAKDIIEPWLKKAEDALFGTKP